MNTIQVGAFEAKTNLSNLLREVEKGTVIHITRRGKPVAVLKKEEEIPSTDPLTSLSRLRNICKDFTIEELISLRDAGRKRQRICRPAST